MLASGRTIRILQAVICILASLGVVAFTFYAERQSMTSLMVVTLSVALIVVLSIITFIYAPTPTRYSLLPGGRRMNVVFIVLITFIMGVEFVILASMVDGLIASGVPLDAVENIKSGVTFFFLINVILLALVGLWKKASRGDASSFINKGDL